MGARIFLLFGILIAFVSVSESSILLLSSLYKYFQPTLNLTRTCLKVVKNLHEPVKNNDCESVMNNPSLPDNRLIKADVSDCIKKPVNANIEVDWLVGVPYKSPYSGQKTNVTFSFETLYDEEPKLNKLLNPVEPTEKYSSDENFYFAKYLTAKMIASKADTPVKAGKVTNKKHIITHMKIPKYIKCLKPLQFKIRFYTSEVPGQKELDYMYITYKGIVTGC